jgi:hypothetical protein
MAGSWNAKRAYLADSLSARLAVRFVSVTHVMVAAWTGEVLHAIRMHPETFRALAPDSADAFTAWWEGRPPLSGSSSTMILVDPKAQGRTRRWIDLDAAIRGARPRYGGYRDLVQALARLDRK